MSQGLRDYGEVLLFRGITGSGSLIEVWVAPDGDTWSVVRVAPETKITCFRASGAGFVLYDVTPVDKIKL